MTDWLTRMISETTFDDPVETKVDSLDNVFKVKQTAELIGVSTDSIKTMSDSAIVAAADSALNLMQSTEGDTLPPKPPPKPWSLSDSPVGEYLAGAKSELGTQWFGNPNISFMEWMSDVRKGTGDPATLFGKPLVGISKTAPMYDPSGEPGEEKYNEKYVGELIRRMRMLENPEIMITKRQGGRQHARIDDEYERMFSKELDAR